MTDEQRKMVEKLNEDNKQLNEINKSQIEASNARLVAGILLVIVLLCMIFFLK